MKDYVYFAQSGNMVKIGRSCNPLSRTASLGANLIGLLPGGDKEAGIHLKFKESRLDGEWFKLTKEIQKYIIDNGASNLAAMHFGPSGIKREFLIKLEPKLFARIAQIAKEEKRKPGPMIVILLERLLNSVK